MTFTSQMEEYGFTGDHDYFVDILKRSDQLVHFNATYIDTGMCFAITFVYRYNRDFQRIPVSARSVMLSYNLDVTLCVIGDSSYILFQKVKASEIKDFRQYLRTCELTDIVSNGSTHIWCRRQKDSDRVFTKIDTCLVHGRFLAVSAVVEFLSEDISVHTPILLKFQDVQCKAVTVGSVICRKHILIFMTL